jgi:hypothetical protein
MDWLFTDASEATLFAAVGVGLFAIAWYLCGR